MEQKKQQELENKKNQGQIRFFETGSDRNEAMKKNFEEKSSDEVDAKTGELAVMIKNIWKPDNRMIEDVPLQKKEVIRMVYRMKPEDALYRPFKRLLVSLKADPKIDTLEMGLGLVFEDYVPPGLDGV